MLRNPLLLIAAVAMPLLPHAVHAQSETPRATEAQPTTVSDPAIQRASELPALPYAPDALDPVIDPETMLLHHGQHHKAYVDNLMKALEGRPELKNVTLDSLLRSVSGMSPEVRNNAGGHYNHSLFWRLMAPAGTGGQLSAQLKAAIDSVFGSEDAFRKQFKDAVTGLFGAGWVWLVRNEAGRLEIVTTYNQDNPLMDVAPVRGRPLLALDVWEHAYYLKYNNRRADYVDAWWGVVNWNEVNTRFNPASAGDAGR
jgi:Fe-Mn family superoxide dismutase